MDLKRFARHLFTSPRAVQRAFPPAVLGSIERAIAQSEAQHRGEVRFAVEGALDSAALFAGQSPRERALEVFAQLGVWDTEDNNGVLIYLLLADHDLEIVADRGIDRRVGPGAWERICNGMEAALRRGAFEQAIIGGIEEVTRLLARHFPPGPDARNELPDRPVIVSGKL
jgi:uncharacterized membrane protein